MLYTWAILLHGSNKASPRLRSEETVGKTLLSRLLWYRGRVAEQSPQTSDVNPTDLKQQKPQRRQSLGAPQGQCDRRYIANPTFKERAEVDLIFAWYGALLTTGPRWVCKTKSIVYSRLAQVYNIVALLGYNLPSPLLIATVAGSRE